MYRIIFLAEAINEAEKAAEWYAQKQEGLNTRFIEHILISIEKIQSDKIIYGPVYRGLGRIAVKRFPYVIYFKKEPFNLYILMALCALCSTFVPFVVNLSRVKYNEAY